MFLALLFLTTTIAFTISAVSGGGAGLALLPVLRSGLSTAQVPVALSIGSAINSSARIGLFLKRIDWRIVRWFVPSSLPGAALGVWLLSHVSPVYMELVLGLFLLGNMPMLFRKDTKVAPECAHIASLVAIGFVAGFLSGMTGAVGLLFNRFYLRYGLDKEGVVATRAANEVALHVLKVVIYSAFGMLTPGAAVAGLVVGAGAVSATFGVRYLLPYIKASLFRRLGYVAMVLAGCTMTVGASTALAAKHGIAITTVRDEDGFDTAMTGFDQLITLEFRADEGLEIEFHIDLTELPADRRDHANALTVCADRVVVEEVRSWRNRSYELYVYRGGSVRKYEI